MAWVNMSPRQESAHGGTTDGAAHVAICAGNGMMVDEPHTYDPPASPSGHWTQAYARVDPVGQHVSGYYRAAAPAPAPVPSPSTPPPSGWPTGSPGSVAGF